MESCHKSERKHSLKITIPFIASSQDTKSKNIRCRFHFPTRLGKTCHRRIKPIRDPIRASVITVLSTQIVLWTTDPYIIENVSIVFSTNGLMYCTFILGPLRLQITLVSERILNPFLFPSSGLGVSLRIVSFNRIKRRTTSASCPRLDVGSAILHATSK